MVTDCVTGQFESIVDRDLPEPYITTLQVFKLSIQTHIEGIKNGQKNFNKKNNFVSFI